MPTGKRTCGCPSRVCRCSILEEKFTSATSNVPRKPRQKRCWRKVDVVQISKFFQDPKNNQDPSVTKGELSKSLQNISKCYTCGESGCSCLIRREQFVSEPSCNMQVELPYNSPNMEQSILDIPNKIEEKSPQLIEKRVIIPRKSACGCHIRKCKCRFKKADMGKAVIISEQLNPANDSKYLGDTPLVGEESVEVGAKHQEETAQQVKRKKGSMRKSAGLKVRKPKGNGPGTGRRACGCPSRVCRCVKETMPGLHPLLFFHDF